MQSNLVEELFTSIVAASPERREKVIATSTCSKEVKAAAVRLVKAYESRSTFLNDDLMSDIARADPKFFDDPQSLEVKLKPGHRINNYVVESVLGEGGMSVVYGATQSQPIKRNVAIKVIRPSILAPKTVLRFFREQQALALISHPHVATLYEVGVAGDGVPFAAMERVNGSPITAFCRKHKMESRQRIILFLQACSGLNHVHHHGIVHRDIKPGNVLVGVKDRKPMVKLIDFGIAKISHPELKNPTVTRIGQVLGSPRYMSPEQFEGGAVDRRSDVYSAALVLFELLARSPMREGNTTEEIFEKSKVAEPIQLSVRIKTTIRESGTGGFEKEDPSEFIKFAKRDLDWILLKALAEKPADRYQTIQEFSADLRSMLRDQPVTVARPNSIVRTRRLLSKHPKWMALALMACLFVAGGAAFNVWQDPANDTESELENKLSAVRIENAEFNQQNAAANSLVMRLLASDMYELTVDQFDLGLIPVYQAQYKRIKSSGGPRTEEDKTVYGILAVLYAIDDNFDLADGLLAQVSSDQQSELRQIREKICSEYADNAKLKLASLTDEKDASERAMQQMTLGKCYIVWNMLSDSQNLLEESIEFFDEHQPGSYDSLAARNALIRVHGQAKNFSAQRRVVTETLEMFHDSETLQRSDRGRDAYADLVRVYEQQDSRSSVSPSSSTPSTKK